MLSRMIVDMYARSIEAALWISLALFVFGGWKFTNPVSNDSAGLIGAAFGFLLWVVVAVTFFGALLVLEDIRKTLREIQSK
jgi:TRAP-type C4-dicarboxylate transport system permease small subunit